MDAAAVIPAVPGPAVGPSTPATAASEAAGLAVAIDGVRRARTAAAQAAADTEVELSRLVAAQAVALDRLADTRRTLARERAASSSRVRELYVSGGDLSVLGELLTGGRPEDLVDRAQLATVVAAGNTMNTAAAEAATREAADLTASIAAAADRQITLATTAGVRAGALEVELSNLSARLAAAQAAAREIAAQRRQQAQQRAAGAAREARVAAAGAELLAAQAAVAAVLDVARRAGASGAAYAQPGRVPTVYRVAVQRAGASCPPTLSPGLLAAQLAVESGWNPMAVSSAGAQGLAQFLPGTWAGYGADGNGDGRAEAFNPFDAIVAAAAYDCAVARMVARVGGDPVDTMLAAYNAGPGAVLAAGGVPASAGVARYVVMIRERATGYVGADGQLR